MTFYISTLEMLLLTYLLNILKPGAIFHPQPLDRKFKQLKHDGYEHGSQYGVYQGSFTSPNFLLLGNNLYFACGRLGFICMVIGLYRISG